MEVVYIEIKYLSKLLDLTWGPQLKIKGKSANIRLCVLRPRLITFFCLYKMIQSHVL